MKRNSIAPALACLGAGLMLSACAAVDVYGPDGKTTNGIPFNVKVPVVTQTTLRTGPVLVVTAVIDSDAATDEEKKAPLTAVAEDSADARKLAFGLRGLIESGAIGKDCKGDMKQCVSERIVTALAAIRSLPHASNTVQSNTLNVETILAPKSYEISARTPLIGSNNSDFEFGSDGTLNKAQTNIQDDTFKTLLSLVPIAPLLTQELGLSTAAHLLSERLKVKLSISQGSASYTLRKRCVLARSLASDIYPVCTKDDLTPLTLEDALGGKNGVELVSIGSDEKKADKPDKPGYEISGKITLPDTGGADKK